MKVLIAGMGKSGRSAYDFLTAKGYDVEFVADEVLNSKTEILENEKDRLFSGLSFIVASPGVSLDLPFFKEAKKRKINIVGELELGAINTKGNIVAVTGTNGKTTTVTLVNFLLRNFDKKVFLGGNVGVPVTSFCELVKKDDVVVLECSSYQLESVKEFHANIACILNFSVDHLKRHKTLERYMWCKNKIVKNQTRDDVLILNADNDLLMKNKPRTKAKIYYFSTKKKVVGCYVKRGCIYFNDNEKSEKLLSLKKIKLVGEHNLSNVLASCLIVYLITKNINILNDVEKFNGVAHRIEYVEKVNNVSFYNDSKATNIDSTLVAVRSFKNKINLILGGSDKGYDFEDLFKNLPKNVKNIAVFGETKQKIAFFANKYNFKNLYICESLRAATVFCFEKSKPSYIVLLSPACASFDQFSNYEERGNVFKNIVKEIAFDENKKQKQVGKIKV
ncbi:MAG: UDP-N-acetylmuramoyl-L-alanine--D-glutamate ligase [Clostridia bacterium]|nr:UDP-N-acetylmuramoyl-L-alanine--D-glutamate ligase [Clostridia bacterium]